MGVTSADTYALAGSLTGVTAGQLPVVIGGESYTAKRALTPGVSGTNWSPTYGSNTFNYGHLAYATNTNTGTIPQPTITFNDTFSSIKFAVGLVLKETTASGIAGGDKSATHLVYWDGSALHDPSNRQIWRWLDQLAPQNIWIFDEVSDRTLEMGTP